jgi:RpiR family carbohydrate utilization transcriptional regulator
MLAPQPDHGVGVRARLRSEFGELTPAQRRLGAFLLQNLAVASDYTITDLAEAAGVSIGTISQLCRRLGLRGYQELRLGLARDAVARVFGSTQEALADTAAGLEPVILARAADRLGHARRIECVGVATAGLIAAEAALKLRKLGLDAVALGDAHQQAMSAALLGPDDVLLAISHSGRTLDTLGAAQLARERGAFVVVIGGQARSPLSEVADALLLTSSSDTGFHVEPMASTVAQLAVVQTLFLLLLERMGSAAERELARTQAAVEGRHITGRAPGGGRA